MTAGFIAAQRIEHGVPHAVACRALDVAPSTFYKHLDRPPTDQQRRRASVDVKVKQVFDTSEGTYGSPRVKAQLRRQGVSVSTKTVEASMVRQGLCARPKRKTKGLTGQALRAIVGRDDSLSTDESGGENEIVRIGVFVASAWSLVW